MRNKNNLFIIAPILFTTITASTNISAADPNERDALVGKCVSQASRTRSACFQKCASDRSSSQSALDRIVAKRIKYAPNGTKTDETQRSPSGAKRVDPLCLDYFDIQLRNAIDFGPIDAQRERALKAQLNRCAVKELTAATMATSPIKK